MTKGFKVHVLTPLLVTISLALICWITNIQFIFILIDSAIIFPIDRLIRQDVTASYTLATLEINLPLTIFCLIHFYSSVDYIKKFISSSISLIIMSLFFYWFIADNHYENEPFIKAFLSALLLSGFILLTLSLIKYNRTKAALEN